VWWYTSVIPESGRLKQEVMNFRKPGLHSNMSFLVSKKKKKGLHLFSFCISVLPPTVPVTIANYFRLSGTKQLSFN
jgi:hypothetical protein